MNTCSHKTHRGFLHKLDNIQKALDFPVLFLPFAFCGSIRFYMFLIFTFIFGKY